MQHRLTLPNIHLFALFAMLFLSGCETLDFGTHSSSAKVEDRSVVKGKKVDDKLPESADKSTPLEQQQYRKQAEEYVDQAVNSPENLVDLTLNAAEFFIQGDDTQGVKNAIEDLPATLLTPVQRDRLIVIRSYIDYAEQNYKVALYRLSRLKPETTNRQQLIDGLLLRSFCYQAEQDYQVAIEMLIQREQLLTGAARRDNARYTWQVIRSLTEQQRLEIAQTTSNSQLRQRLEQSGFEQYDKQFTQPGQFAQWQSANQQKQTYAIDNQWQYSSPKHIALLLPLTSRYGAAAKATLDGIQFQDSLNTSGYRPQLFVYDIGDDPTQIQHYYNSAEQNGADLIIGPIGIDYANQLSNYTTQSNKLTTLLLGGNTSLIDRNSIRLTLSPEQEGVMIAQKALAVGYQSAALLMPNSKSGQRIGGAFNQYWLAHGGKISSQVSYSKEQYDHSVELKQLFNIDKSEYRHHKLSDVLGYKPKFTAQRRNDIDFIVMIADNESGRIIRPQINFFQADNIPVLSPPRIFNGNQDAINNMDLDNTHFPAMPMWFEVTTQSPYQGQLNELYALGMDAYKLAANITELRNDSTLSIRGNIGLLSIEASGEVTRQPVWATFKQGLVVNTEPQP